MSLCPCTILTMFRPCLSNHWEWVMASGDSHCKHQRQGTFLELLARAGQALPPHLYGLCHLTITVTPRSNYYYYAYFTGEERDAPCGEQNLFSSLKEFTVQNEKNSLIQCIVLVRPARSPLCLRQG